MSKMSKRAHRTDLGLIRSSEVRASCSFRQCYFSGTVPPTDSPAFSPAVWRPPFTCVYCSFLTAVFLFSRALLLLSQTISFEFVAWDDRSHIVDPLTNFGPAYI